MQFYKINDWPYIAVLDPITGKPINMLVSATIDQYGCVETRSTFADQATFTFIKFWESSF